MYFYCVDDDDFHRSKAKQLLEECLTQKKIEDAEIIECKDGEELITQSKVRPPKLVLLDINMPNLDGLSALVQLKKHSPATKVFMASSENEKVIKRLTLESNTDLDDDKKEALIKKVIERVASGVKEDGKINSVLEAASRLGLDPVVLSKKIGASGFLQKPYPLSESIDKILPFI